jgi:uncharacterized protein DUF4432
MPELWGEPRSRSELLRRVGRLEQVAGVRLVTLGDGIERGVRVLEFRTGGGFEFDVLVDRAFDIGRAELAGRPLAWLAAPGVVAPWYYEAEGWGWFRAWGGGLVVTCGLDHTMGPTEDSALQFHQPHMFERVPYGLHGRVGGLPARLVGYGEAWAGDACTLWAEGEVRQASVFGEELILRRRIEAEVGGTRLVIRDRVENVGHSAVTHMLLYHCNVGFPVVDEGSELLVPSDATRTDPWDTVSGYRTLTAPRPDFQEACFYERALAEPSGLRPAGIVNRRLGIGFYQVSRAEQLPELMLWRMLGEGAYAVAIEPGTNRALERARLRELGEIMELAPGEGREYELEVGALDGHEAIDAFAARVAAATARWPNGREEGVAREA